MCTWLVQGRLWSAHSLPKLMSHQSRCILQSLCSPDRMIEWKAESRESYELRCHALGETGA